MSEFQIMCAAPFWQLALESLLSILDMVHKVNVMSVAERLKLWTHLDTVAGAAVRQQAPATYRTNNFVTPFLTPVTRPVRYHVPCPGLHTTQAKPSFLNQLLS